jgi:glucose-1-phosphate thymidylyltransferase
MDTGTPESMVDSSNFIRSVEKHQGLKIACLEEIAYHNGWIGREALEEMAQKYAKNDYGKYLAKVIEGRIKY